MNNHPLSILLLWSSALFSVSAYGSLPDPSGFPCWTSASLRLNHRRYSNPQDSEPPFELHITNSKGNQVRAYTPGTKLKVRLVGLVHFRGLLLEPRLALPNGFLIGSLRGGTFLKDNKWQDYGIRYLDCAVSGLNDTITHSNDERKWELEVDWISEKDVGPVQFMLTLVSEMDRIWERWTPQSGFLLPIGQADSSEEINNATSSQSIEWSSRDVIRQRRISPEARLFQRKILFEKEETEKSEKKTAKRKLLEILTESWNAERRVKAIKEGLEQSSTLPPTAPTSTPLTDSSEVATITPFTKKVGSSMRNISTGSSEALPFDTSSAETELDGSLLKPQLIIVGDRSAPVIEVRVPHTIATTRRTTTRPAPPTTTLHPPASNPNSSSEEEIRIRKTFPSSLQLDEADLRFLNSQTKKTRVKREEENQIIHAEDEKKRDHREVEDLPTVKEQDVEEEHIVACNAKNPCQNEATCTFSNETIHCECVEGFTGKHCQDVDYCVSNNCRNGGECVNNVYNETYSCNCTQGYVGSLCEVECPSDYCNHGGKCLSDGQGELYCDCPQGAIGRRCEREINECNWLRCQNAKKCVDKFNDYECICEDGWMGKDCQRPCQDVYGSCRIWKREGQCELADDTDFFETNCAVTCEQCTYKNETIRTTMPLPTVLLSLAWLLGKWETSVKARGSKAADIPFDFSTASYNETVTFSVAPGLVFGTPAINFTSIGISLEDPSEVHQTSGFLTIRQYPAGLEEQKAALLTTSNMGFNSIEEGIIQRRGLDAHSIHFVTEHLNTLPHLQKRWPQQTKRVLEKKNNRLYQTISKKQNERSKRFTKIYVKTQDFVY